MQIKITADDVADKDILRAFADATGWTSSSPLTKKQWMAARLARHVAEVARRQVTMEASVTTKAAYVTQLKSATAAAQTVIAEPQTGVG